MLLCCFTSQVAIAKTQFLPNAWPKSTRAPVNSSPVLGDLDGDGILEIVIGSDNHKVYAWKPDGTLMPGWPMTTNDSVRSSPALSDIDGDGRLDVIAGSFDNKVYVWNFNGSVLPGWPVSTGSVVYSSPAVGDIDGDQRPEIVVGSFDNQVYAWNDDGTIVRGWPKPTGSFVYSSPALADIDRDGLLEVIAGTDSYRVFAWNGDGSEVEGWPTATENVVASSPAVGDIDGDGDLDIVVGSWDKVYAWNSRGEIKPGWPVMAGHRIPSSPALVDLNNDRRLEILIGCKDGKVYGWDAFGRPLQGWPTVTDGEVLASPVVGDINGDGILEIAIGSTDSKVYVWDAQGRLLPGWPKKTAGAISSTPAIADLDHNGTIELVIGSKDNNVYAWSVPPAGTFPQRLIWPNFHGNLAHTGTYGRQLEPIIAINPPQQVIPAPSTPRGQEPVVMTPAVSPGEPVIPIEIREGYISDLAIADYDDTTITLTWTSPPGIHTPQTTYDIRYSPQPITEESWANAIHYPAVIRPAPPGTREVFQLRISELRISDFQIPNSAMLYFAIKAIDGSKRLPVSRSARLDLPDSVPPNKISKVNVAELKNTLLELSWVAPGDDGKNGTAQEYDIRYSEIPLVDNSAWERATRIDNEPAPLPAGTEQQVQIQKPWDDREIFWGIRAIDEALNISELSEVAVWTPKDSIPPSRIVDLRVTKISGNNVTLAWTAPGNNLNIGKARRYEIRSANFPITEMNWDRAAIFENFLEPGEAGSPQIHIIQGIPIGMSTFVGVKTIDRSGNISALSNVVETAVDDIVPPTAITNLKLEKVGKDWAQVSWTASGDDNREGAASAYVLRYGGNLRVVKTWTHAMDVQELPAPSFAGTQEAVTIRGLNENTAYFVGLRVLDSQGNSSDTSNILRIKTLGRSTPEAVTDLVIEELRADGITLNWTVPQDFGENTSQISGYDIRYALSEITESTWGSAIKFRKLPNASVPKTLEAFTFTGEPRDSAYYIALKSYDALGNFSALSNVLTVPRVDTVAPDPVIDLFVEETGQDWVRIRWTATGDDKQTGQVSGILVRVASTLKLLKTWDKATDIPNTKQPLPAGMKDNFTITGLNDDSTFYVAMKSVDTFGNTSEISNIVRAKTKDVRPPAAIHDLESAGLEGDAVILKWTATGENGMQGRAKIYDIRYAEEPITSENWDMLPEVPEAPRPAKSGKGERVSVSGLVPNTKYYFAMKVIDASGNVSPVSNVAEAYTPDTEIPSTISSLRAEKVERASILLTWMSPGDDGRQDSPARYDIRYSTRPLSESSWSEAKQAKNPPEPSMKGEQERYQLSGLQNNKDYHIGIKALDASGNASDISNTLHVYTSPEMVTDLEILDFSGQVVTLTWTTPGGIVSDDRKYDIRYATTMISDEDWSQANPVEVPERTVKRPQKKEKVQLTGLPQYEQLFFAVKIIHEEQQDMSDLSNVVELNRLDLVLPGSITDLKVTDLGEVSDGMQSLKLMWRASGDNELDGTAAKYELRYGITRPQADNWESLSRVKDVPVPQSAGSMEHTIIQIPAGEDTLYFAVRTYDEALNVSDISNIAQWAPEDHIPPVRITDFLAERLQNGDIKVSWTAPGDNENRGIAAFYDIRFASKRSDFQKWDTTMIVPGEPLPEKPGTRQEYVLTGLKKQETFYIAITTTDDAKNTSELSNIVEVAAIPVERIDDLAFVGGTDTTITLSWTAPQDRDAAQRILRYEIRYSEKQEYIKQWRRAKKVRQGMVPQLSGSTESITIEKLSPNKRYYVAVKSVEYNKKSSEPSNIVVAYTADTIAPEPITDLIAETATQDSVTLVWTVKADDEVHGMPELYELRYSLEPIDEINWDTTRTVEGFGEQSLQPSAPGLQMKYTISGLEENTRYYFGVRAIDAGGNISSLSNAFAVRTRDVTPPQAIADLKAMFPTMNSVMLSWTCPSDASSVGARALAARDATMTGLPSEDMLIEEYDIRYRETPFDGAPLDDQSWEIAEKALLPPKSLTPGSVQEFIVSNLEPGKSYHFAMKAIDQSRNISPVSNTVVESTLPVQFTFSGTKDTILSRGSFHWEIVQGKELGEIQQDHAGVLHVKKKTGVRALSPGDVMTAVYPQGNQELSIPQGELRFHVKSAYPFTFCAKVSVVSGVEPYYLCYTSDSRLKETPIQSQSTIVNRQSTIENYVFSFVDPAVLDNQWHEIRLNLAQDILEGTGQIYREASRFSIRGTDVTLREIVMKGAVISSVSDFEDRVHPQQGGWKIHFGSGTVQLAQDIGQGNSFLHAASDTDNQIVLTYPRDGSAQLSDMPFFLTNVKAGNDFKLILKVKTKNNREYYLAYMPDIMFQEPGGQSVGLSGNYIYLPLSAMVDNTFSERGDWTLISANIEEDLRRYQLEYDHTSWLSFHGREISLDNIRFSTDVLDFRF